MATLLEYTTQDSTYSFTPSAIFDVYQQFTATGNWIVEEVYINAVSLIGAKFQVNLKIYGDNGSDLPNLSDLKGGSYFINVTSSGYVGGTLSSAPTLVSGTKYWIRVDNLGGNNNGANLGIDTAEGYGHVSLKWNGSSYDTLSHDFNFRLIGSVVPVDVRQVRLGSGGNFLVATAVNGVYLSTDFGDNWTKKTPDGVGTTDWAKGICSSTGTYIIVVSDANAIYRSANSGGAWASITPAGVDTFSVNDLATSDDGQFMVIVGQNTTDATESCYVSIDYGATWTAYKPVASSIEYTTCDISNDGTIIAVSTTGNFYISLNSGATWLEQGMASTAETWACLGISGDGTAGIVANTNDNDEVFLGVKTNLYSLATWAEADLTSAGRALLDDATATAQATTLGLGTGDSPTWVGATLSGLTQGSVFFAGAGGVISQDNSNLFWDNANNRLGIGTSSPEVELHIKDSTGSVELLLQSLATSDATIRIRNGASSKWTFGNDATNDEFIISTGSILGTPKLTILQDGKVGMGTGATAPNAPLEVKGVKPGEVGGWQSGQLQVTGDGTEFYSAVITGHNAFNGNTQLWYLGNTSSSSHNDIAFINRQNAAMHFSTNNTTRMTIDDAGKVGIGEAAPETLSEWTGTAPYLTLHNSTHEDTDGGRESRVNYKGEQSGGEETTLIREEIAHDGTSDDEKGYKDWFVNAGSDGDSPTFAMRLNSDKRLSIGINSGLDPRTGLTVSGDIDILHTAIEADDHAFEIDVDAATFGDVKAIDIVYTTGILIAGKDEGIILINIDEVAATGGEVFGLEVLATDGSASIYGMKVGAVIGPIHQDSGIFIDPTTGTDNTPSTDVPNMIDGNIATFTTIFEAQNEYIIIGAAAAFEEIEFIITTPTSNPGIKPTFWYSSAAGFTQFTPVDGTNGFRNTGVVAWDASDLVGHIVGGVTGTYDIKVIRTKAGSLSPSPILGYAKTAATVEYTWDKNGDVSIHDLIIGDGRFIGSASDPDAIAIAADGKVTLTQNLIATNIIVTTNIGTSANGTMLDLLGGNGNLVLNSALYLSEVAASYADVAGRGQLWVKNTDPNELWFTDDGGADVQLGVSGGGTIVQIVNTQTGVSSSGTTILPDNNTIPQSNEGDEYMTLAITPTNTNNKLKIEVVFNYAHTIVQVVGMALFQDSTANALAGVQNVQNSANAQYQMVLTHYMTAGTISTTTFKVRAGGGSTGATMDFNSDSGEDKLGGVMASSITITEIEV